MAIKIYKPYTPSSRNKSSLDFSQLSKIKPNVSASLSQNLEESNGKYNNSASITINQLLFLKS